MCQQVWDIILYLIDFIQSVFDIFGMKFHILTTKQRILPYNLAVSMHLISIRSSF